MSDLVKRTWVCLSRPSDVRNIAGAIRAVANFGLAGIKVVTDQSTLFTLDELEAFSSGASRIVPLNVYHELVPALAEASLVVGTSRRQRNHQHLAHLYAYQMSVALNHQPSPHILLGNERTGLSHKELDLCHAIVEINSCASFPSLNLAHAVACIAYELARPFDPHSNRLTDEVISEASVSSKSIPQSPTSIVEDEAFLKRVIEVSQRIHYPPSKSSERFARQLRSLLRRAQATPRDYGLILGIFRELERLGAMDIKGDQ